MAIITLTSDMGLRDHYVAAVKMALLQNAPQAYILDISHEIAHFNISQAAYVLKQIYRDFPAGTVHIIGVQPEWSMTRAHVIVKENDKYFISADNGIYSFLFDRRPQEVYEITISQNTDDLTFPTKDIFCKVAAHLAQGGTPEIMGKASQLKTEFAMLRPILDTNSIRGHVMHIDSYENILTNITTQHFKEVGRGREFELRFARHKVKRLARSYGDVTVGDPLALFGSNNLLEIAINQGTTDSFGGAASLFGLKNGDTVRIDFEVR